MQRSRDVPGDKPSHTSGPLDRDRELKDRSSAGIRLAARWNHAGGDHESDRLAGAFGARLPVGGPCYQETFAGTAEQIGGCLLSGPDCFFGAE